MFQVLIALLFILCHHQSDGQPSSNMRIFRGSDATKNKFPWFIYITVRFPSLDDKFGGGGVLISMKHILTVAHLFFGNDSDLTQHVPYDGSAIAGLLDIKNPPYSEGTEILFDSSDVLLYPDDICPGTVWYLYYLPIFFNKII